MLLPATLLHLQGHVTPMATTPEVRALGAAVRGELGSRGGVLQLLGTRSGWVDDFQAFASILGRVVPGDLPEREIRALAGRTRAVYLPGIGALANGALAAGKTRATLQDSLRRPEVAAPLVLHLTHEVAGHAYMAENTPMGREHERAARWRDAVSLAGRTLPLADRIRAADSAFAGAAERWVICAEGWARWITRRLAPRLAEALPRLAEPLLSWQPSSRQHALDDEARGVISRLLSSDPAGRTASLEDWLSAAQGGGGAEVPRAVGLALFEAIEAAAGPRACVQALHDCCSPASAAAPPRILLAAAQARSARTP